MKYEKQLILTNDRNPNGGEDFEASRPFMVGEVLALEWNEGKGQYGDEDHYLRPAWSTDQQVADNEGRCWHHSWCWNPAEGYTATGYGSELMPFEEGVKILVEHEVFAFPLPEAEYFRLGVKDAKQGRRSGRVVPKEMVKPYREGYESSPESPENSGPFLSINTTGFPVAVAPTHERALELSTGAAPLSVISVGNLERRFPLAEVERPVAYSDDELVDGALGLKRLPQESN